MVEKEVRTPSREFLTSRAKSVKSVDPKLLLAHTRPCYELQIERNCKNTIDKPLTTNQQIAYNQMLKDQREKEERYIKRKNKKFAAPKEEFRNF